MERIFRGKRPIYIKKIQRNLQSDDLFGQHGKIYDERACEEVSND